MTFFVDNSFLFSILLSMLCIIFLNARIIKQIVSSGKFRRRFQTSNHENRGRSDGNPSNENGKVNESPPQMHEKTCLMTKKTPKNKHPSLIKRKYSASLPDQLEKIGRPRCLRTLGGRRLKIRKRLSKEVCNLDYIEPRFAERISRRYFVQV